MSVKQAWYCPNCKAHHGPHVDTCPNGVDAVSTKRLPPAGLPDTTPVTPRIWPDPYSWPHQARPYWLDLPVAGAVIQCKPDPSLRLQNGHREIVRV